MPLASPQCRRFDQRQCTGDSNTGSANNRASEGTTTTQDQQSRIDRKKEEEERDARLVFPEQDIGDDDERRTQ
jgi:hypothetical protein